MSSTAIRPSPDGSSSTFARAHDLNYNLKDKELRCSNGSQPVANLCIRLRVSTVDNTIIETMLDLEEIDKDLYRSKNLWLPLGARGVFGNVSKSLCEKNGKKYEF